LADIENFNVEPQPDLTPKPSIWRELWDVVQTLLLAAILYFAIDAVFARVIVENVSMENTLMPGNVLVVNKLAYKLADYKTGDIVIFHNPNFEEEDFIKRLIGTPGDTVVVKDGKVLVNGTALEESYIRETPDYEGEWVVPDDAVFVLGDNRRQSSDSHSWGYVPLDDVVGKAIFIYWPPKAIKPITDPYK
jgi:signal peptidase I